MAEKFLKHWDRSGEPLLSKIKDKVHRGPPLKERLSNSIYRLQVTLKKLEANNSRVEQRDNEFFKKCADAQVAGDTMRATMYANECAEIRKIARTMLHSQMAVEQVIMRLETIRDFGDVTLQMGPVVPIVQAVKGQLMRVLPDVSYELGTISETLNSMVMEVGEATGSNYDMVASGEAAQKILKEAGVIAEQKMNERFPELPTPDSSTATEASAQKGL